MKWNFLACLFFLLMLMSILSLPVSAPPAPFVGAFRQWTCPLQPRTPAQATRCVQQLLRSPSAVLTSLVLWIHRKGHRRPGGTRCAWAPNTKSFFAGLTSALLRGAQVGACVAAPLNPPHTPTFICTIQNLRGGCAVDGNRRTATRVTTAKAVLNQNGKLVTFYPR